jgi:hypothetical protein
MEGHKSWETKNIPKRANHKGNKKKSSTGTLPPNARSILNKERGRRLERNLT